jgi:hypothetical protein
MTELKSEAVMAAPGQVVCAVPRLLGFLGRAEPSQAVGQLLAVCCRQLRIW